MAETKNQYIKRNSSSNYVKAGATALSIGAITYGGGKISDKLYDNKIIKHENLVNKHATSVEKGAYSASKFQNIVVDPNKKFAEQKINNFNEKGKFQINSQKASNTNVAPENKKVFNLEKRGFDPRNTSKESRVNQVKFMNNKHNKLNSFIKPMIDNTNKFNDQIKSNRLKATPTPKNFRQALHNVTNPNPPDAEIKDFKVPKNPKASNQNLTKVQRFMGKAVKYGSRLALGSVASIPMAMFSTTSVADATIKGNQGEYKRNKK